MCGRGQTRDSASSAGTERRLSFRIATPAYAAGQPAAVESGDDLPTRTIMQPTTPLNSPIPVPEIDSDEPVPVIPTASVAPLDGPPDGERIKVHPDAPGTILGLAGREQHVTSALHLHVVLRYYARVMEPDVTKAITWRGLATRGSRRLTKI